MAARRASLDALSVDIPANPTRRKIFRNPNYNSLILVYVKSNQSRSHGSLTNGYAHRSVRQIDAYLHVL